MKNYTNLILPFLLAFFPLFSLAQAGSGEALKFNGSSNFVECGSINLSGSAITLQTWVKVQAFKTASPFISSLIGTEQGGSQASIRLGDAAVAADKIQFVLQFGTSFSKLASTSSLSTNKWYHIAATYDGSSMKIYINGILDASMGAFGSFSSNDIFEIGRNYANSRILNGEIDEVSVFTSALSESTIREWMCQKINSSHPNYNSLSGYWPLNEGSGTTTDDASTNSNIGTLSGSPIWKASGAAIGDESVQVYTTSPFSIGLSHPDGDSMHITSTAGTFQGVHLYRVDSVPNVTSVPASLQYLDTTRYWGVFPVNTGTYDAAYYYNGNNAAAGLVCSLSFGKRNDNSSIAWSQAIPDSVNYTNQVMQENITGRSEIILAVGQGGPHTFNYTISEPLCNGDNNGFAVANVTGGLSPYSYVWSGGSATDTSDATATGYAYVTVTDANSCVSSDSVFIDEPNILSSNANSTSASCADINNGSITLSTFGGTAPFSYAWSDPNNSTTASINAVYAGNYTVTITDANGCFDSFNYSVGSIGPNPFPFLGNDTILCNGTVLGLTTEPNGGPFVSYNWSNGNTSPILVATGTGVYSVTVTNSTGCSGSDTIFLNYVPPIEVNLGNGPILGIGQAVIDAGAGFNTYQWNTGATTQAITVGQSGSYWVKTTDTNGCKDADTVQVQLAPNGINTIQNQFARIYPNPTQDILKINLINPSVEIETVSIMDLTGKIVRTMTAETQYNVADLNTGMYFITLTAVDGKTNQFRFQKL